ncbi:GPI anchored dioxygenase [Pleurostoma richardsiae]|uniref:GPI anchored dioxygenase n=1 Tax=Pleurostoma richardsiae TaxID=41990 RepID=A0AA38VVW2_9PEZI|nr:GPI anchored dioxygenase [Pleurostoma richardsiae]
MYLSTAVLVSLALAVVAHPGHHHEEESKKLVLARREHQTAARRGLEACQNKRSYQELQRRALQRRAAAVDYHRKAKRTDAAGVGHNLTDSRTDITADSDESTVFGSSHSCILNPEGETGPYYVKGELIRQDLREDQPGVPIVIDGQFIDVQTCEPIQGLFWDLWNCNSTGVYSGLVATGNGNTDDTSNLDATFLRGIQETDSDGVVQFLSVFPGHYDGRTTHHHMVAWLNATILPNNTLTSGYAAHIGQLFWDQDLINTVESSYPYNTNTISITENADDRVVSAEVEDTDSDPFFDYVYLGDSLDDGLFGWVTIGINSSATYSPNYSFEYGVDGGIALSETVGSDSVNGGGTGGGSGLNGTMGGPNGTSGTLNGTAIPSSGVLNGTATAGTSSATVSTVVSSGDSIASRITGLSLFTTSVSILLAVSGFAMYGAWLAN